VRVLHVASEMVPLVKTGGLADVVGALVPALARAGVDARALLPGYPAVPGGLRDLRVVGRVPHLPGGGEGRLLAGRTDEGAQVALLDAPHLFDRPGGPYAGPDGRDWPDNPVRFAALSWAARAVALDGAWAEDGAPWTPDVVHVHDWQAGLAPAYLELERRTWGRPRPATVATIHNMAFQGTADAGLLPALNLPPDAWAVEGVEYHGAVSTLKAALHYADRLTTVSPTYAREIRTPAGGFGLEGLLERRRDDLVGILNGIDAKAWDPAADPALPAAYGLDAMEGKRACAAALRAEAGLADRPDAPLFAVVSRLTWQKGTDLLAAVVPRLLETGGQLVLLGSGDRDLEDAFRAAAAAHPGAVAVRIGYDEGLSHRIQAGADALLVPSRFEPCGLTQMYALRYGTVPVVRRTGGLADTVVHADATTIAEGRGTGVVFEDADPAGLAWAIGHAADLVRRPDDLARVRRAGMAVDNGWDRRADAYAALYRELAPGR